MMLIFFVCRLSDLHPNTPRQTMKETFHTGLAPTIDMLTTTTTVELLAIRRMDCHISFTNTVLVDQRQTSSQGLGSACRSGK